MLHSALHLILLKINTQCYSQGKLILVSCSLTAFITHLCVLVRTILRFRCCWHCTSQLLHFIISGSRNLLSGEWHQQCHILTTQDSNNPLIKSYCFLFHSYRPFPYHPAIIHCPIIAPHNSSLQWVFQKVWDAKLSPEEDYKIHCFPQSFHIVLASFIHFTVVHIAIHPS